MRVRARLAIAQTPSFAQSANPQRKSSPVPNYVGKFSSEEDAVEWIEAHPRLTEPVAASTKVER
jgi:hypothetical protein